MVEKPSVWCCPCVDLISDGFQLCYDGKRLFYSVGLK